MTQQACLRCGAPWPAVQLVCPKCQGMIPANVLPKEDDLSANAIRHVGSSIDLWREGNNVCLRFNCKDEAKADELYDRLVICVTTGNFDIKLRGEPVNIEVKGER